MIRAKKRLDHEYESFPLDYIKVNFKKETFLEWHFLFIGQNGTPFEGGEYHGTIVFPENYPLCPPSTQIITPNGRFQTNECVCFSISDFHPENWKPAYTMSAFLQGVYSFMMSETTDTVGSLVMNEEEIRELAKKSREFNKSDDSYNEMFNDENNETIKCSLFTSTASDPLMKVPSERSQSGHSNTRDKLVTHRPRRSLSVPVHKSDRDSRVDNAKEFTSIASDPLTKIPSERSRVDHSSTKDKLMASPPKKYTASSHTTKLQISESHAPNSSSSHRTSPIKHISHTRPLKPLAKDGLCKNTSKNRSINSSSIHSPSSVEGKESHTSKLERTLAEPYKFNRSHKSATRVSQHPERPDNVTVQSSYYPVNNIDRDNYDRDTTEISQPNKELSSEESRGRLSKKTSSNRSMNSSSLHSRTSLTENTLPQTTRFDRSTHFSEESKNVSVHKVDHTPNPLTDRENHILQDSNARIDKYSARVMDLENSNLPPSDYPSEPHSQVLPKVLHEISSTVKSNITSSVKDAVSSNPSKPQMSPTYFPNFSTANRTSSVTSRNQFHSLNSPASARFDNKTPHLTTSSATNEFFQSPTVNISAFRPPLNSSNSSTHPTSPIAHINQTQSPTTAKDGLIKNTNSDKFMSISSLLSPTQLSKSTILPETTRDNRSNHFSERSENVSVHKTDHTPNSLTDRENGDPSQFLNKLTSPTNVVNVPFSDMDSDSFIHTLQESNARIGKNLSKSRVIDLENSNLPPSDYPSEPLPSQVLLKVSHEESPSMNLNVTPPDNLKETVNFRVTKPQMSPPFSPNSSTEYHTSSMTEDRNPISHLAHEVNASHSPNSSATDIPSTGFNSNRSTNTYSLHLSTSPVKNRLTENTAENRDNIFHPIFKPSVLSNKPQNYGATGVIKHKPPFPFPCRTFLTINNSKGTKSHISIQSYGSSSSVTSRSNSSKLKQQPDSSYSPKIKYKDLYFDCVDEISKPENIGSDRYLGKTTEVSNSFETTKEFPRNECKPSIFSVNKLFNFIIAIIRIFVSLIILFYRKIRS